LHSEKILIAEDESLLLIDHAQIIRQLGYPCLTAKNGKEAIEIIKTEKPDVVFTDQQMPHADGFTVLRSALEEDPDIPVVLFTGHATVELAVQAMKNGAYDYIEKPFFPEIMELALKKAVQFRRLKKENRALHVQLEGMGQLDNVIGNSKVMNQVANLVLKVSKSEANVLIWGESGVGKELVARSIHKYSHRHNNAFIPLDCVALPSTLLESELFGFEKGAFTGAVQSKPGVFELAEGGTLFLDEITELDPNLQAKLLRVLQERQFRRIGGREMVNVNVRIISATNRNPETAVNEGILREDLYYRLNVVPIFVPPLRDRKEDIPLLVSHFIDKYNPFSVIEIKGISRSAIECLKKYKWPGNCRELENLIHRVMSLSDQEIIELDDLPEEFITSSAQILQGSLLTKTFKEAKHEYMKNFGKQYIGKLLTECKGNISEVARRANLSRRTLYRMITEFDIER